MKPKLIGDIPEPLRARITTLLLEHVARENDHDIPGILSTLVAEPIFEMKYMPFEISRRSWWTRKHWRGRDAVILFYEGLFRAFRSFRVEMTAYIVSRKGVVNQYAIKGRILAFPAFRFPGIPVKLAMASFFPFDPGEQKLVGEDVYLSSKQARKRL